MISMIVAMDSNGVIGLQNELPWNMPADLAYFKKVTSGHTILMGRKTADSLGRPLPNRRNIILSRQKMATAGFRVENSVENILKHYQNENVFIIGGSQIYEQFLPHCTYLYVTHIDAEFKGDTWFPQVNWKEWRILSEEMHVADEKNPHPYTFTIYKRS